MMAAPENSGEEDRVSADRQATEWLILLQEEPDDAEIRAQFEIWLRASKGNAVSWAETQRVAALIGATQHVRSKGSPSPVSSVFSPTAPRNSFHRIRPELKAGIMAAAAACLAVFVAPNLLVQLQADHVSGTAEVRTVRLDDGSTATLGTDSAIAVDYGVGERRVRLLRGDAYFEVHRDTSRPFLVAAGDAQVTVLGTGFEVRLHQDGAADVAVRHGLVQVENHTLVPSVSEQLGAGDQIALGRDGPAYRAHQRPERVAAWTGGRLIANDRSIRDVIEELRPWYGGVILAHGAGLDEKRVTGVYDLEHPAAALKALGQAHDAAVYQISPWILVISS